MTPITWPKEVNEVEVYLFLCSCQRSRQWASSASSCVSGTITGRTTHLDMLLCSLKEADDNEGLCTFGQTCRNLFSLQSCDENRIVLFSASYHLALLVTTPLVNFGTWSECCLCRKRLQPLETFCFSFWGGGCCFFSAKVQGRIVHSQNYFISLVSWLSSGHSSPVAMVSVRPLEKCFPTVVLKVSMQVAPWPWLGTSALQNLSWSPQPPSCPGRPDSGLLTFTYWVLFSGASFELLFFFFVKNFCLVYLKAIH